MPTKPMFAWKHTTTPLLGNIGRIQGVKEAWNAWSLRTVGFESWEKSYASGLRALAAFSLMVVADLTSTPPADEVKAGTLVLPAFVSTTAYKTHLYQQLAAAILHAWRVIWVVSGRPSDSAYLMVAVSTTDGDEATAYGEDAGWLPWGAAAVVAHGDGLMQGVVHVAQLAPLVLERTAANDDPGQAVFRKQTCTVLGRIQTLLSAWSIGGHDAFLDTQRKILLDDCMKLIGVAPRQDAPTIPDDGPASDAPPSLPSLPSPQGPADGGGAGLLLLLAAAFFLWSES